MIKKTTTVFIVLLCLATGAISQTVALISNQVTQAVVTIQGGIRQGSGFIISPDGYILTNSHVVKDSMEVEVIFKSEKQTKGRVVYEDSEKDIALVKVDEVNLPVIRLGNSNQIHQGDEVLAVGSPKGLPDTVSRGIVSSSEREIDGSRYIQTDAAINEGSSGGPLINMLGEAVGILTMKVGDAERIGFAIPINDTYAVLIKLGVLVTTGLGNEDFKKASGQEVDGEFSPSEEKAVILGIFSEISGVLILLLILGIILLVMLKILKRKKSKVDPVPEIDLGDITVSAEEEENLDDIEVELEEGGKQDGKSESNGN